MLILIISIFFAQKLLSSTVYQTITEKCHRKRKHEPEKFEVTNIAQDNENSSSNISKKNAKIVSTRNKTHLDDKITKSISNKIRKKIFLSENDPMMPFLSNSEKLNIISSQNKKRCHSLKKQYKLQHLQFDLISNEENLELSTILNSDFFHPIIEFEDENIILGNDLFQIKTSNIIPPQPTGFEFYESQKKNNISTNEKKLDQYEFNSSNSENLHVKIPRQAIQEMNDLKSEKKSNINIASNDTSTSQLDISSESNDDDIIHNTTSLEVKKIFDDIKQINQPEICRYFNEFFLAMIKDEKIDQLQKNQFIDSIKNLLLEEKKILYDHLQIEYFSIGKKLMMHKINHLDWNHVSNFLCHEIKNPKCNSPLKNIFNIKKNKLKLKEALCEDKIADWIIDLLNVNNIFFKSNKTCNILFDSNFYRINSKFFTSVVLKCINKNDLLGCLNFRLKILHKQLHHFLEKHIPAKMMLLPEFVSLFYVFQSKAFFKNIQNRAIFTIVYYTLFTINIFFENDSHQNAIHFLYRNLKDEKTRLFLSSISFILRTCLIIPLLICTKLNFDVILRYAFIKNEIFLLEFKKFFCKEISIETSILDTLTNNIVISIGIHRKSDGKKFIKFFENIAQKFRGKFSFFCGFSKQSYFIEFLHHVIDKNEIYDFASLIKEYNLEYLKFFRTAYIENQKIKAISNQFK